MRHNRLSYFILGSAILLHLVLGSFAAWKDTPTIDEYAHVPAGLSYWRQGAFDLYSKNPPLIKLWATWPAALGAVGSLDIPPPSVDPFGWGPWMYGLQFEKLNTAHFLNVFISARLMILFLSCLCGWLIFIWLKDETGPMIASISSAGFLTSNTVLAHGHLATVDIGTSLLIFLTTFVLWRTSTDWKGASLSGMATGGALAAKFTGLFLLPMVVFKFRSRPWHLIISAAIALMILHASYGFSAFDNGNGGLQFKSNLFNKVMAYSGDSLLLFFPRAFVSGLDAQIGDAEVGEFGNYLLGQWSESGWWYYNLFAFAVKEHPLTVLLTLLAPLLLLRRRPSILKASEGLTWAVSAFICLGIPLVFLNPLQVGIRYLLPLYPFLFVIMGYALRTLTRDFDQKATLAGIGVVTAWFASALLQSPNHVAYFNWVSTFRAMPEEMLLDSNLDWGQDLYQVPAIKREFAAHTTFYLLYFGHVSPSLYGIEYQMVPSSPVKGIVVVSANFWKGMPYITPAPDGSVVQVFANQLDWLKSFHPIRRSGSLLIFDTRDKP